MNHKIQDIESVVFKYASTDEELLEIPYSKSKNIVFNNIPKQKQRFRIDLNKELIKEIKDNGIIQLVTDYENVELKFNIVEVCEDFIMVE